MRRLDQDPDVVSIAQELKLPSEGNAVSHILYFCHERIRGWLKEHGPVESAQQLENLVCRKLHLTVEEFSSDEELETICDRYAGRGEGVFKSLPGTFDSETFATLIERRKADRRSPDRFVALIDCRGAKAFRKFFTRWHEIAHVMTNGKQLLLPLHRSSNQQNGEEKLMDVIAAQIGYYTDLFDPILREEMRVAGGKLTFEVVDRVRARYAEEASFEATMNACIARSQLPVSYIECGMGLKKSERNAGTTGTKPQPKLRVLKSSRGDNAPHFHLNMAVPALSKISSSFQEDFTMPLNLGTENLSIWTHSDGRSIGTDDVCIATRKSFDKILALVTTISKKP
jgi:hypothetical protein